MSGPPPERERAGPIASDSLAAESTLAGGLFSENRGSEPLGVKGASSNFANTDVSGARTLAPARDASQRDDDDVVAGEWKGKEDPEGLEGEEKQTSGGDGGDGGASTEAKQDTSTAAAEEPEYGSKDGSKTTSSESQKVEDTEQGDSSRPHLDQPIESSGEAEFKVEETSGNEPPVKEAEKGQSSRSDEPVSQAAAEESKANPPTGGESAEPSSSSLLPSSDPEEPTRNPESPAQPPPRDPAPSYVTAASRAALQGGEGKPKGRNLTEGGFDDNENAASDNLDVDNPDDPASEAIKKFQGVVTGSVGGEGTQQGKGGQFDRLDSDQRI